jgi:hypothetical protein
MFGKPMNTWENNTKMDIKETGTKDMNCISLVSLGTSGGSYRVMNLPVSNG